MIKEVYSRKWYMGKRGELRKCKGSTSRVWEETECRSKMLDIVEKGNFKREELLEKYIAKMLYRWNDRKFENEYLKKLERNQWK